MLFLCMFWYRDNTDMSKYLLLDDIINVCFLDKLVEVGVGQSG